MPIIFVHGVSNRNDDPSYVQGQQLRQRMVEQIIGPKFADFPSMAKLQEVYWGDLGVNFLWNMKSLPTEITLESVETELAEEAPLAEFLSEHSSADSESSLESAGGSDSSSPLLNAAKDQPEELVRYIARTLVEGVRESQQLRDRRIDPTFSDMAAVDGAEVADLMIAAHEATQDKQFLEQLRQVETDAAALELIGERLAEKDSDAFDQGDMLEGVVTDKVSKGWSWLSGKVSDANDWVKDKWEDTKEQGTRAASVLLLRKYREQLSKGSFLFFGDIFEYIKRGQGPDGTIKNRVRDQLKEMAQLNRDDGEPLVVISHSFGGEVVYDLLTSGELKNMPIDLWVTVGSQVGLFAEMAIFDTSPQEKPESGNLAKPAGVEQWINIYDTVDVFSFLCEPVFGEAAVTDIKLGTGTVKTSHGAYFTNPRFYEIITEKLSKLVST